MTHYSQHAGWRGALVRRKGFILACAIIFILPFKLWAAEKVPVDDLLIGFEEEETPSTEQGMDDILIGFEDDTQATLKAPTNVPSLISLNGHLKLGASYNIAHEATDTGETDWRGLSRLKSEVGVGMQIKWHDHWRLLVSGKYFYDWAYRIKGRDEFSNEVLDQYEEEAELGEAYLQGHLHKHVDFKTGRQIVVWGRSDNIRVTDVLNPLDLREPGLIDIEDLRLPVTLTRLDGYWDSWNLTAIAIHENRFNKDPVFGHDFFPGTSPLPPEEKPSSGGGNTEWALALNGIFSGNDISFYWADIYDENTHVETTPEGTLVRKHARVNMWGVAGTIAVGNWLLIAEGAYWQKLKFFNAAGQTFDRLDGLIGIEYSGWNDTLVVLDCAARQIIGFERQTKAEPDFAQENNVETALRISRNYLNDTLEITMRAILYGSLGDEGAMENLFVKYEWNDFVSITTGVVLYQSGEKFRLNSIDDNDRIYMEVKYSF